MQRIANRQPYSFSYCGYRLTKMFNTLCCCFKKCMSEPKLQSFNRRLRSIKKLEKARHMLSSEKDIEDYLYDRRILRLLIKTVLSHR